VNIACGVSHIIVYFSILFVLSIYSSDGE